MRLGYRKMAKLGPLPKASVIIPHFRDKKRLHKCLIALAKNLDIQSVEIIVVDNGPATLSTDFQHFHPDINFLHEQKQGAAHARNTGVNHARGEILIFTDSDCIVAPNFLRQALKAGGQNAITGGDIQLQSTSNIPKSGAQAFEHVFAFNQQRYIKHCGFSATANLVTPRWVFDKVGPFRSGVSEDLDWCRRAIDLGFIPTFDPSMIVSHPSRKTWAQLRDKWRRITAESFALHRHHNKSLAMWWLRASLMPVSIPIHAPKVLRSSALNSPHERLSALTTLAAIRLWRMQEMMRLALRRPPANTY